MVTMITACTIIHVPGDDAEINVDKVVDVAAPDEAATVDGSVAEDEPEDKDPED